MDSEDYDQIGLVLDRLEAEARKAVGMRIAQHTAQLAKSRGLGGSRRWIGYTEILDDAARRFNADSIEEVREISREVEAFALVAERSAAFIDHLEQNLLRDFVLANRWNSRERAGVPLPDVWTRMKPMLDTDLQSRRTDFFKKGLPKVQAAPAPVAPKPPAPRNPGGRPLAGHWDSMWAAIAAQLYSGDLQPKTQADIERAMADWLEQAGFDASPATVRGRARTLWQAVGATE